MTDASRASSPVVLVVEDDPATRTFLADNLCSDGYEPLVARSAAEARRLAEGGSPRLAVIDLGLPDGSGLSLLRAWRTADASRSAVDPRLPVIVLSGRTAELDRLRCFESGADDFVAKPFGYFELRARIAALLRRAEDRPGRGRVTVGTLDIDPSSRTVRVGGRPVSLSQKEYLLATTLASAPNRVFTKNELMRTVWGTDAIGTSRTLDSHACRLRHKLGLAGERFVINVWGVGYRLCEQASA